MQSGVRKKWKNATPYKYIGGIQYVCVIRILLLSYLFEYEFFIVSKSKYITGILGVIFLYIVRYCTILYDLHIYIVYTYV